MTEARKTETIIAVAIVVVLAAWITAPRTAKPGAFRDRGTSFFPGFTDPRMAQSLEVIDFDNDTATAHPFKVQVQNGLWTIPSEYNYPVDGTDRLAKTIAGIIALKKDSVATDNVSDQERTGTLDPLDETLPNLHGRGKRVTIKGENDRILADIIVGKELTGRPQFQYVRLADQARVYISEVGDLNISSKFTDWIDRNLLHMEWNELDEAMIRNYSLDKSKHSINLPETLFIQKLGVDRDNVVHWTMRDLQRGEQVNTFRANLLNTALNELTILGVRPKPLAIAEGFAQTSGKLKVSHADLADMEAKGFYFTPKGDLVSDEGEVLVHTHAGVFFRLLFGAIAYGDPVDDSQTDSPTPKATAASVVTIRPDGAANPNRPPAPASTAKNSDNRFLIITASFDPNVKVEKSARDAAETRADEMQMRFAPWYYVISGQSFERLRLPRSVLVKTIDQQTAK